MLSTLFFFYLFFIFLIWIYKLSCAIFTIINLCFTCWVTNNIWKRKLELGINAHNMFGDKHMINCLLGLSFFTETIWLNLDIIHKFLIFIWIRDQKIEFLFNLNLLYWQIRFHAALRLQTCRHKLEANNSCEIQNGNWHKN